MGGLLRFSAVVFSAVVFSAATSSALPAACCSFGELPRCCKVRRFLTLDGFLTDCTAPVPAVAPTVAGRSNELWRARGSGGLGFLEGWTLLLTGTPALVRVRIRAPARSAALGAPVISADALAALSTAALSAAALSLAALSAAASSVAASGDQEGERCGAPAKRCCGEVGSQRDLRRYSSKCACAAAFSLVAFASASASAALSLLSASRSSPDLTPTD